LPGHVDVVDQLGQCQARFFVQPVEHLAPVPVGQGLEYLVHLNMQ